MEIDTRQAHTSLSPLSPGMLGQSEVFLRVAVCETRIRESHLVSKQHSPWIQVSPPHRALVNFLVVQRRLLVSSMENRQDDWMRGGGETKILSHKVLGVGGRLARPLLCALLGRQCCIV